MSEVPELLAETIDHVGWERVQSYLADAEARARSLIMEYLS